MLNWLKRLFKKKDDYYARYKFSKFDYQKAWDSAQIGDDVQIGDLIYFDENGIIRKAKAMDEKEEIEIGCLYRHRLCDKTIQVIGKSYKHRNEFNMELRIVGVNCFLPEMEISEIYFRNTYRKYYPSPERKEMELKLGAVYENREIPNMKAILHRQEGIYVFLIIPEARNDIKLTVNQFKYMYKEWHEPRTLKLEDLNKLWVNPSIIKSLFKIELMADGLIKVSRTLKSLGYSYDCQSLEYNQKLFFESFREATQEDIDNLTKGE